MKFTREIFGLVDFIAECFIAMPTSWMIAGKCASRTDRCASEKFNSNDFELKRYMGLNCSDDWEEGIIVQSSNQMG